MPWRGPLEPGEFPTLGHIVAGWIETHCVIPDRAVAGRPLILSDQQYAHLLWQFRLHPDAEYDEDRPAAPFVYNGDLIVRPQKWGKGPFSAARICAQAVGPVLFGGWDDDGEPIGIPWATPHIQVAAVAEDQTDNIWRALKPMIELGPLADVITDTGLGRMNLASGGIIERVSSNAKTRLGARTTYVEIDQPESITKRNGGEDFVDTLLRNNAGMSGRWAATGNAHDPTEQSQQQTWIEKPLPDVYIDYPDPLPGSWANRRDRRRILKHAYQGAPWVDIDRIESDCDRLAAKGDPAQAERFFGNRVVAGASKAFDLAVYKALAKHDFIFAPGRIVTAGFDGSLTNDATGLVITDVAAGHQAVVAWWKRPDTIPEDEEWRVPIDELDEAVDLMFSTWTVWRLYGDPPHYRDDMNRWAGLYGSERVVEWWTNDRKKMAIALREYRTDMTPGVMSHGPLRLGETEPDEAAVRAHQALIEHHGNAVRKPTNMRDEDDGTFLWLIGKESAKSPLKIDLAMCGCLSWIGAGFARRAGVLQQESYGRAQWGSGARPGGQVARASYLPCKGCGKPIHPRLHEPDAAERGRCLKCRATAGAVKSANW